VWARARDHLRILGPGLHSVLMIARGNDKMDFQINARQREMIASVRSLAQTGRDSAYRSTQF
jgi:hypothetical protein